MSAQYRRAARLFPALVVLGFAAGLPNVLVNDTLKLRLNAAGVDLAHVGAFSLVGLAYAAKALWAPLLDRYRLPLLGRRRGWMALFQLLLVAALLLLAWTDPHGGLRLVGMVTVIAAVLSASQDIVVDGHRADSLREREVGLGSSLFVTGYRLAWLAAGALAPWLADLIGWSWTFSVLAAVMLIGVAGTLLAPEPPEPAGQPATLSAAIIEPFRGFVAHHGRRTVVILLAVLLFKASDQLAGSLSGQFLQAMGYSGKEIGAIRGGVGLVATIAGGLLGGLCILRLGVHRALWIFGGLQLLSNLGYMLLPVAGLSGTALAVVIVVENLSMGLAVAAFMGWLLTLCEARVSATQYALLTAAMAFTGSFVGSVSGLLVKAMGWPDFFVLSAVVGLPGLLLLTWAAPWRGTDHRPVPVS